MTPVSHAKYWRDRGFRLTARHEVISAKPVLVYYLWKPNRPNLPRDLDNTHNWDIACSCYTWDGDRTAAAKLQAALITRMEGNASDGQETLPTAPQRRQRR